MHIAHRSSNLYVLKTLNSGSKSFAYLLIGPATTIVELSLPVRKVHPRVLIVPTVGLCPYIPQ